MAFRNASTALPFGSALLISLLLGACSGGSAPPPPDPAATAKAAQETKANKQLALYEQMRTGGSVDLAAALGNELVSKYPGTAAAAQIQQTLPAVRMQAAQKAETQRLARLWVYTATPEAGGTQYASAIESQAPIKAPDKKARIRLVLRQHPKWGQSVYLLLDNATFDCRKGCAALPVRFDDAKAERMKATIPSGGEPALFIDPDKEFIAKLQKAKTVAIDVTIKDGGEQPVTFEVSGYNPEKMPNKPK